MDRLTELAADLTALLDAIQCEAAAADRAELTAPLAWLDEASQWLRYELARAADPGCEKEPVPFTYIPLAYRRS